MRARRVRAWLAWRGHGVLGTGHECVPRGTGCGCRRRVCAQVRAWRLHGAWVARVLTPQPSGAPAERTSSISSGAAGAGGFAAALIASLATAADGVAVAARLRAPSWRRSGEAYPGRALVFAQNSALPYGVNYIDVSADALRTPAYCSSAESLNMLPSYQPPSEDQLFAHLQKERPCYLCITPIRTLAYCSSAGRRHTLPSYHPCQNTSLLLICRKNAHVT